MRDGRAIVIALRERGYEALRIGVAGCLQNFPGGAGFDEVAPLQDHDRIGVSLDQVEVMRHQKDRGAHGTSQVGHDFHDLPLAERVEGRRRLVCDQQPGLEQHHGRQHDSLAHAPGELVRVGRQAGLRIGDLDAPQHLDGALAGLVHADFFVKQEPLEQLCADRHRRVERHHRFLEHHAHGAAPQGAHLGIGQRGDVAPFDEDLAAGPLHAGRQQAEHGARRHRLPAA